MHTDRASAAKRAGRQVGRFEKIVTLSETRLPLRSGDRGKRLHLCARWANPRGELSPVSDSAMVMLAAA